MIENQRNYRIDNLKLLLIFLVLFGHRLELFINANEALSNIYLLIYSFHVPFLLFLSGITGKFSLKRVFSLAFTYFLMQALYLVGHSMGKIGLEQAIHTISYAKPYWLLWYLFVLLIYTLLIPVINTKNKGLRISIVTISIALSLLVGLDANIGYTASLSRMFVFMPFFILGFYFKDYVNKVELILKNQKIKYPLLVVSLGLVILVSYLICKSDFISKEMLYGSYPYKRLGYHAGYRFAFMLIAVVWIIFLYTLMPNYNVNFITSLGANTLTIYLFHGFIIKLGFGPMTIGMNIFTSVLYCWLLILIYGNRYVSKGMRFIFCGDFIIFLYEKINQIYLKKQNKANKLRLD